MIEGLPIDQLVSDFALPFFKVVEESAILPLYTLSHEPGIGFAADAAARANSAWDPWGGVVRAFSLLLGCIESIGRRRGRGLSTFWRSIGYPVMGTRVPGRVGSAAAG